MSDLTYAVPIRRRPWRKRILRLPHTWMSFYRLYRKSGTGIWISVRLATLFAYLTVNRR